MNLKRAGLGLVLATICFCMRAPAEMPRQFYFEDYYNGTNGLPYTGYIGLQLQLYSTASNGICLYEDSNTVEVVDGFYATLIGDNTASGSLTNALAGGQTFVQVIVNGTPLSPREPLVPVPYALNAAGVASNTITAAMISSAAVQSSHLANGAVTANKLAGDVDDRYVNVSGDTMGGELDMDENGIHNVAFIDWHGNGIDIEGHGSSTNSVWGNWNADLLDGSDGDAFVKKSGDTMTGDFSLAGSLILLPTEESVRSSGFQSDGDVTMHWMTESGTYFKYGATGGDGDRFHFGSDGEFKAWGDVYSMGNIYADRDLAVSGQGRVQYEPEVGTNQYALWVRNFASTADDARGLLVTTPEYNGSAGIIFHAASLAGGSMASRFIVGADGNVGVGVNDPQNKLHVAGDARVSGNVLIPHNQNIMPPNFNPNSWGGAGIWGPNAYLNLGYVRELHVAENANFPHKVKIGTSSDYATLNVGAPTNLVTPTYAARFESALGADSDKARGLLVNFPHTTNPSSILFHAMSGAGPYTNSRFIVKADGKVGIGTAYPEATLHVAGDIRLDGTLIGDGSGLTNLPMAGESDPVWTAASSLYATTSLVASALSGYLPLASGGVVSGPVDLLDYLYFAPHGTMGDSGGIIFSNSTAVGGKVSFTATSNVLWKVDNTGFHKIWDAGLDGSNSGLDADLLDGYHASSFATTQQLAQKLSVTGGSVNASFIMMRGDNDRTKLALDENGNIDLVGGEESAYDDNMHIQMRWDLAVDEPSEPSIDLKPYGGAVLRGLKDSDRWWTDGRLCATNSGKTSEFFAVKSSRFVGDGSGLTNLPVTGWTTNQADVRYVNAYGDTMTGPLTMSNGLIMSPNALYENVYSQGLEFRSYGSTNYVFAYYSNLYCATAGMGGNKRFLFWSELAGLTNGWETGSHAGLVQKTGDTMTGPLNMGGQSISNALFVGDGSGLTNVAVIIDDSNYAKLDADNTFAGSLTVNGPAAQTNLVVSGWAQLAFIPPQGGLSMGTFTNGLPSF